MIERGIGCWRCDYTGVTHQGSGQTYVAGGDVHEDWHEEPCPECVPPGLPEPDYRDADYRAEEVWG